MTGFTNANINYEGIEALDLNHLSYIGVSIGTTQEAKEGLTYDVEACFWNFWDTFDENSNYKATLATFTNGQEAENFAEMLRQLIAPSKAEQTIENMKEFAEQELGATI